MKDFKLNKFELRLLGALVQEVIDTVRDDHVSKCEDCSQKELNTHARFTVISGIRHRLLLSFASLWESSEFVSERGSEAVVSLVGEALMLQFFEYASSLIFTEVGDDVWMVVCKPAVAYNAVHNVRPLYVDKEGNPKPLFGIGPLTAHSGDIDRRNSERRIEDAAEHSEEEA